jgi:hypothetical protein
MDVQKINRTGNSKCLANTSAQQHSLRSPWGLVKSVGDDLGAAERGRVCVSPR